MNVDWTKVQKGAIHTLYIHGHMHDGFLVCLQVRKLYTTGCILDIDLPAAIGCCLLPVACCLLPVACSEPIVYVYNVMLINETAA